MPTPSASNRSSIAFGGDYASIVLWFGKLRRVGGSSGFIRRRRRTGRADGLRRRQHPVSPACDGNADRFRHGRYRRHCPPRQRECADGARHSVSVQRRCEIGRASCRERVCQFVYISVVGGKIKKKK